MRTQTTRTIAGRVNVDGSIQGGGGFAVQRVNVGAFNVWFPSGTRLLAAMAVPVGGGGSAFVALPGIGGGAVAVTLYSQAGAVTDAPFYIHVTVAA